MNFKKPPYFTIIIPTLNEEKHLPLLLKDLTQQTYKNFEVIVIDGKSEDHTIAQANQFKKKLQLTVIQTSTRNASFQRNLGGKQAGSPYLVFFDADTRIPPEYLKLISQYLTKNPVDVLTTWNHSPDIKLKNQIITKIINYTIEFCKYFAPVANGSHLFIKTSAFNHSLGFNPQIHFGEDTALIKSILKQGGQYTLLKTPQAVYSLRRFERDGYLRTLTKIILLNLNALFRDPTQTPLKYHMGGTA